MVPPDLLRRLRNDLPMSVTITSLGREGPPSKMRDGRFVFLCPYCGDLLVAVNPRNNLAHCLGCGNNFNNIDHLLSLDYDFADAVARLELWLHLHQSKRSTTIEGREGHGPDRNASRPTRRRSLAW
jgi:DNA primase